MATLAQGQVRGFSFWQKMTLGLGLFIVFGFLQFAARGFVDYTKVPVWLHVHGIVMLSWLTLSFVQSSLAQGGNLALHRRLGWIGAGLAVAVVCLGSFIGIKAIQTGHLPPFFTPPYFLALTQIGVLSFGTLVTAAILRRRQTEWHRRLMLGALILIMEPALGRLLPMPFLHGMGEWLVMVIQLGTLGIVMRHDRKTLGGIHPATATVALVIVLAHVLVETLAISSPVIAMAERLSGN